MFERIQGFLGGATLPGEPSLGGERNRNSRGARFFFFLMNKKGSWWFFLCVYIVFVAFFKGCFLVHLFIWTYHLVVCCVLKVVLKDFCSTEETAFFLVCCCGLFSGFDEIGLFLPVGLFHLLVCFVCFRSIFFRLSVELFIPSFFVQMFVSCFVCLFWVVLGCS